jgi:hypothetical protein
MKTCTSAARLFVLFVTLVTAGPVAAETKPFQPVAATYDRKPASDPGLQAALSVLREAVEKRDMKAVQGALAKNFTAIACKPDPRIDCLPGKPGVKQPSAKLTPVQRMEQGMCCEDTPRKMITREITETTIFGQLANALVSEQVATHPSLPGVVCTPALAAIDRRKAAGMVKATEVDPVFLRVTEVDIPLHETPAKDAKIVHTIPAGSLVPLMADMAAIMPQDWNAYALPTGGVAYSDIAELHEAAPPSLCLAREGSTWKMRLFIGRLEF